MGTATRRWRGLLASVAVEDEVAGDGALGDADGGAGGADEGDGGGDVADGGVGKWRVCGSRWVPWISTSPPGMAAAGRRWSRWGASAGVGWKRLICEFRVCVVQVVCKYKDVTMIKAIKADKSKGPRRIEAKN